MDQKIDWNVFIGGITGVIKGLKVSEKGINKVKNLINLESIEKNEITCLNWGNKEENELLIGYSNQVVKMFDLQSKSITFDQKLVCGEGSIKGISKYNGKILTGTESGDIKLWDVDKKIKTENALINAGKCLERVCHKKENVNCIATGGKENDLKIWDLEKATTTFVAKNVRPDELQLRVPVWISDITFLPNDSSKVAVSSRHGFVRLYDPNSTCRRPVINIHVPEQAFTCIAASSREGHVLVGSGTGHMFLVDLRNKGVLLNHYKGFVGGIRQVACAPNEPYIVSVGLDRHVRVHNLNNKQLVFKEYFPSRLTCVLLRSDFTMKDTEEDSAEEIRIKEEDLGEEEDNDEFIKENESDKEYEELFNNMETVGGEKRKKTLQIKKKRKRPKV